VHEGLTGADQFRVPPWSSHQNTQMLTGKIERQERREVIQTVENQVVGDWQADQYLIKFFSPQLKQTLHHARFDRWRAQIRM